MAVLAHESGMSSEGELPKQDSSHEFNAYIDRQLQNKLIEVAEENFQEDFESKLLKPTNNVRKNGKVDPRVEDITGWFPDAKFVARRNNDGARTETKPAKDTFIHPWRDYRSRKEESFIFKHYTDTKKYIEQYRTDHGCHSGRYRYTSSGSFGELRRQAFQTSPAPPQQTVQVTVQQVQQGNSSTNNASLSYSSRKEQLGTLVTTQTCSCSRASHNHADSADLSHRYKFAPGHLSRTNTEIRSHYGDSDNSSESGDCGTRTPSRRVGSATSVRSKSSMPKSPTKILVPANPSARPYPMQALTM